MTTMATVFSMAEGPVKSREIQVRFLSVAPRKD